MSTTSSASESTAQHEYQYFQQFQPAQWNRGAFFRHCRNQGRTLSDRRIDKYWMAILATYKLDPDLERSRHARLLINQAKECRRRRLQDRHETLVNFGTLMTGNRNTPTIQSAMQSNILFTQTGTPTFAELDSISSDSNLPPTRQLSPEDESLVPDDGDSFILSSLDPVRLDATMPPELLRGNREVSSRNSVPFHEEQTRLRFEGMELELAFSRQRMLNIDRRFNSMLREFGRCSHDRIYPSSIVEPPQKDD